MWKLFPTTIIMQEMLWLINDSCDLILVCDIMICNVTYACWFDIWVMHFILMLIIWSLCSWFIHTMCHVLVCISLYQSILHDKSTCKQILFFDFTENVGATLDVFKMWNLKLSWWWMLAMFAFELSFLWH